MLITLSLKNCLIIMKGIRILKGCSTEVAHIIETIFFTRYEHGC